MCIFVSPDSAMAALFFFFGFFNVRADVEACDVDTGAVRTPPDSKHWKLTLGEKSLAAPGTRTCMSIAGGFSVGRCTN